MNIGRRPLCSVWEWCTDEAVANSLQIHSSNCDGMTENAKKFEGMVSDMYGDILQQFTHCLFCGNELDLGTWEVEK